MLNSERVTIGFGKVSWKERTLLMIRWGGSLVINGENISVWRCNWIPCEGGLMRPLSDVSNPSLVVEDLLDQDYKWKFSILKECL